MASYVKNCDDAIVYHKFLLQKQVHVVIATDTILLQYTPYEMMSNNYI